MLNTIVWIEELRSDGTNLGTMRLLHQRGKPLSINNLGVVIQEKQMLSLCLLRSEIVHGGEIKRLPVLKHSMLVRQSVKIANGFRVTTVVVDYYYFIGSVTGFFLYAGHTVPKQPHPILCRNNDGYQRR